MNVHDDLRRPPTGFVLRHPIVWLTLVASIGLGGIMTYAYIAGFTNPLGRLDGLPVGVVNLDRGADVAGRRIAVGDDTMAAIDADDVRQIEWRTYASRDDLMEAIGSNEVAGAVIFPANLSASVGRIGTSLGDAPQAEIEVIRNGGSGSLQQDVMETATARLVGTMNQRVGATLSAAITAAKATVDPSHVGPLAVPVVERTREVPDIGDKGGIGLPPLYIGVMATLTGVVGTIAIHVGVGLRVGRTRLEVDGRELNIEVVKVAPFRRFWNELLLVTLLALASTAVIPLVAIGLVGTTADLPILTGVLCGLGVLSMGALTLACVTVFDVVGEVIVILLTTIYGVPSSRGVYPEQALPPFFVWLGNFLPLRYFTDGLRSALYFDGRASAGALRGFVALIIWLVASVVVGAATSYAMRRHEQHAVDAPEPAMAAPLAE